MLSKQLGPQTLRELLQALNPESAPRLKAFLTKSLLTVLARDDTARTINAILSTQIERFMVAQSAGSPTHARRAIEKPALR